MKILNGNTLINDAGDVLHQFPEHTEIVLVIDLGDSVIAENWGDFIEEIDPSSVCRLRKADNHIEWIIDKGGWWPHNRHNQWLVMGETFDTVTVYKKSSQGQPWPVLYHNEGSEIKERIDAHDRFEFHEGYHYDASVLYSPVLEEFRINKETWELVPIDKMGDFSNPAYGGFFSYGVVNPDQLDDYLFIANSGDSLFEIDPRTGKKVQPLAVYLSTVI